MLRRSLLRRGSFTAERAYAPDPRALAALVAARAEAMRLEPGARESGVQTWGIISIDKWIIVITVTNYEQTLGNLGSSLGY